MAKLDSQTPARISRLDYNAIRAKVVEILGAGSGTKGYGQPIISNEVVAGNDITAAQWTDLKNDIINVKLHQDGTTPSNIASVSRGDVIFYGAGYPNTNYETIANTLEANRFNLPTNQSTTTIATTRSTTGDWSTQAECTLTVTFGTVNEARYFFNSGSKINFTSDRTGGTDLPQNSAWTYLLDSAGTVKFGASTSTNTIHAYSLTDVYQTFYTINATSPYSSNFYKIEAKCDVTSNAAATARIFTFKITWRDAYVDSYPAVFPPDRVNGTLSIEIGETKPSGVLIPNGTFTVVSPTYSITTISKT